MPELPEIETIRRALQKHLPGKKVLEVKVRDARLRWPVNSKKLKRHLVGESVTEIERRAKYLLIKLQKNTLILHLGMSGRLLYLSQKQPFAKHDHVIFYLDGDDELRFRDPRRFGMVDAVPNAEINTYPRFTHLGLEPLERSTTAEKLYAKSRNSRRPIKNLLMDATFLVGVGNIYASEALFQSGIYPESPCDRLNLESWRHLLRQVRRVLRRAIDKGGTTLKDFVNSDGETGYFQLSLAVYGREGEICKRCGTRIKRIVQVGRSTFFCPGCQR